MRDTLQETVVQRQLRVIERPGPPRRGEARGRDGKQQLFPRCGPREGGLHHAKREALHAPFVYARHRRLGEDAAEHRELPPKARRERRRHHPQRERVGLGELVQREVLVGVGEELRRVDALELIGGALEVHEVVRAQVVEQAAQVRRSPALLRDASDDHHVDAPRLAGQRVLGQHIKQIPREQLLQQQDQQRVPRRAQVHRLGHVVAQGRGRVTHRRGLPAERPLAPPIAATAR